MKIGNRILGFVPQNTALASFTEGMRLLVGKVGVIDAIAEDPGLVRINFGNVEAWWYPAQEAINHIIADEDANTLSVKIKRLHPDSVIPSYSKPGDAGLDLTAVSKSFDEFGNTVYDTGLAFEIPEGYVGLLFPRSSNAKTDLRLTNSVGVIDSGYRGSVLFKYRNDNYANLSSKDRRDLQGGILAFNGDYAVGNRVGQLIIMPYPKVKLVEVDELSETERGEGSYGSSGK